MPISTVIISSVSRRNTRRGGYRPAFHRGFDIICCGYLINRAADRILHNLRAPGETAYKIPQTGFYRWISCPNYFGEIVVWSGWALATWSLPGLAFAVWTIANLAPRARSNHKWYQQNFPGLSRGTQSTGTEGVVGEEKRRLFYLLK